MLLLMRWESAEGARPGHSRPTQLDKIKNFHTQDPVGDVDDAALLLNCPVF